MRIDEDVAADGKGAAGAAGRVPSFTPVGRLPEAVLAGMAPAAADRLRRAAAVAGAVAGPGGRPETIRAYSTAWRQWEAWAGACDQSALPGGGDVFACYLAEQAVRLGPDGDPEAGPGGGLVQGRLAPASLRQHASAVDKAHRAAGLPPPGRSPEARDVLKGAQRLFGDGGPRSDPLDREGLMRALVAPSPRRACDLLLLVLCGAGMTGPGIAALGADDVAAACTGDGCDAGGGCDGGCDGAAVVVQGPRGVLVLPAAGLPLPARDLLAARPACGPLFDNGRRNGGAGDRGPGDDAGSPDAGAGCGCGDPDAPGRHGGHAYSRPGLAGRAARAAAAAGLPLPPRGLPRPCAVGLRAAAAAMARPGADPHADRDRSLLSAAWDNALRPGTPGHVLWGGCDPLPRPPGGDPGVVPAVLAHVGREKPDRTGRGATVDLAATGEPTGAAELWWRWRGTAAGLLGGDPVRGHPAVACWFRLAADGTVWRDPLTGLPAALSARAVGDVVRARLAAAGVTGGRWAGGSLRTGLATQLDEDGVPEDEIARRTRHKALTSLRLYIRRRPGQTG